MITKREAAVISAYTGFLLGEFDDLHGYIEEKLGRPVWTHELASEQLCEEIKTLALSDFMSLPVEGSINA